MFRTAHSCRMLLAAAGLLIGCGQTQTADREFTTSGNPEADQRAEQRMAREQQLQDTGDGGEALPAQATLYERLGGDAGLSRIVDDFIDRVLADPRVNWDRKGVPAGGLFVGVGSVEWSATPQHVRTLKIHMTQFLALATGGPTTYKGGDIRTVHENMRITNAQFDAAVGDLKATLDKLRIPDQEQKELLAIVETTRPQIAEER